MLKEKTASESNTAIPEKNCKESQLSMKIFVLNSLSTLLITLIVTLSSVWVAVKYTQHNDDKQEKAAVLKLLEAAESHLKVTIVQIDTIGNVQINTDDSKGSTVHFGSNSHDDLPYPMIFTDVITDKRVILNLSDTNLPIFFPSGKELDKYEDAIMRMSYDSPIKGMKYANYRDELKFLQLVLSGEIKYQKGELSEEQIVKANQSFRSEALKDSPFRICWGFRKGGV